MAWVVVTQHNDGVQSGEAVEVVALPAETPAETLQRKADSHQQHGWTVEWDGPDAFHAWKEYEHRSRKDRYIRVA